MLEIKPAGLRSLPLKQVSPFNSDDLVFFASEDLALVISNIADESLNYFSIKDIMTKNDIFKCSDFEKSCSDFLKIKNSRLERFFKTKKSEYVFFDKEEQYFLKEIFKKNNLSGIVTIYSRKEDVFKKVDFDKITIGNFNLMRVVFNKLNIVYCMKPERYLLLRIRAEKDSVGGGVFKDKEKEMVKKILAEYNMTNVTSRKELKSQFKSLAKKYHPDVNPEGEDIFKKLKEDMAKLKKTIWYKKLPDDIKEDD